MSVRESQERSVSGRSAALLCMVLGLTFVGCNGEDKPPTACMSPSFTHAIGTVAGGDLFLGELTSTCTSVEVEVMVNSLSGIFTVGFDLTYPASVVRFDNHTVGPLLLKGSPANNPFFFVSNPSPGIIQVSATRFSPDPSVAAVGNEILMTLSFSKVASGTGVIDFDDSPTSLIEEVVLDETGANRPASFQPDHGGIIMVP